MWTNSSKAVRRGTVRRANSAVAPAHSHWALGLYQVDTAKSKQLIARGIEEIKMMKYAVVAVGLSPIPVQATAFLDSESCELLEYYVTKKRWLQ